MEKCQMNKMYEGRMIREVEQCFNFRDNKSNKYTYTHTPLTNTPTPTHSEHTQTHQQTKEEKSAPKMGDQSEMDTDPERGRSKRHRVGETTSQSTLRRMRNTLKKRKARETSMPKENRSSTLPSDI